MYKLRYLIDNVVSDICGRKANCNLAFPVYQWCYPNCVLHLANIPLELSYFSHTVNYWQPITHTPGWKELWHNYHLWVCTTQLSKGLLYQEKPFHHCLQLGIGSQQVTQPLLFVFLELTYYYPEHKAWRHPMSPCWTELAEAQWATLHLKTTNKIWRRHGGVRWGSGSLKCNQPLHWAIPWSHPFSGMFKKFLIDIS